MTDIGKQVRDLLPEYPHLWSRVIAWAERLEQENAVLREALENIAEKTSFIGGMGSDHFRQASFCAIKAHEALEKARVLREGGK